MSNDSDYYTDDDGVIWRWEKEKSKWVHHEDAPPQASVPPLPEWRVFDSNMWRWWSGTAWTDLYASRDGAIDLAQRVGQDIVAVHALGGTDDTAIDLLREKLRAYPPVRIVTMTPYTSPVIAGTTLVAVVEWDAPHENEPDASVQADPA